MDVVGVIVIVVGGVLAMTMLASVVVIGLDSISDARTELRHQLEESGPYLVGLGVIYLLNKLAHQVTQPISAMIGVNITDTLVEIEGGLVGQLQALLPMEAAVWYFSFVYVFGFAFVLVFPIIAYLLLPVQRHLKELLVAYIINYSAGSVFYMLFIAYGPRRALPAQVGQPMFEQFPEIMLLTSLINTSSNVFPSLHTSMVITALIFAWQTRDYYPRWLWICGIFSTSIVISTMYLGIHWLIDVVAGIGLALVSVYIARQFVTWAENRKIPDPRTSIEADTQD